MKIEAKTRITNQTCKCGKEAKCIIRTHYVCGRCYWKFKQDNLKRTNKGMDIPDKLELLE